MKHNQAILILICLYALGLIGVLSSWENVMITFVPVYMLTSLGLLLFFQEPKTDEFFSKMYWIFLSGFVIELSGKLFGYPLGGFTYEIAFGPTVWGIPFLIGLFWFLLVYSSLVWVDLMKWGRCLKSATIGLVVLLLCILLEPIAKEYKLWSWEHYENHYLFYFFRWIVGSLMAWFLLGQKLPEDLKVGKAVLVMLYILTLALLFFHYL